jgi:L-asparaginase/Glu-tRNA(Gln) amidotransferase subunit D
MERYDLLQAHDMTTEAVVTKLMWLLGMGLSGEELKGAVIAAHQAQELVGLLGVKVK